MKHVDIKKIFANVDEYVGKTIDVCGWVRTTRDSKNVSFVEINDGSCTANLQLVIDKENMDIKVNTAFVIGCGVKVTGVIVASEMNKCEMQMASYEILGDCPADYPLQKKRHSLEFLRTMPHLRVRTNTIMNVQRVRSALAAASHLYFQSNGYTYVHTPLITGNDCEGGGEVFRVTTQPWNATAKTAEEYFAEDFFGKQAFLTVSGQLEGEVAAMALGKIYTFGPVFRAENSNTSRHVSEFWQVEPEVAFAELPDIIEIAEEMIKFIIKRVMERCPSEIEFFDKFVQKGLIKKLEGVVNNKFAVVDYTEAIEMLKNSGHKFSYPVEWGLDLQTEHERYIAEVICERPVFITNYPKHIKSFYMKQNADGKTVAATDLLVPGVGEIIGCSEREADYDKLLEAMNDRGMNLDDYKHYMDLRRFGTVPHSGFGLGLERILMYITGIDNIRDVTLYPRTAKDLK